MSAIATTSMPCGTATPAGSALVSSSVRAKRAPSRDFASARNASTWLRVSTQHSVTPGSSSIGEDVMGASTSLRFGQRATPAHRERVEREDREEDGDRRELEGRAIERHPVAPPRSNFGKRE